MQNPQQNYEVPLHLLQEWFSDLAIHRRLELARVFLAILQEQGVDMDKIFGAFLSYPSTPCKNNVSLLISEKIGNNFVCLRPIQIPKRTLRSSLP